MAAKTCAKPGDKRKSPAQPTIKNAGALRYDNLASVLVKLDERVHGAAKCDCDRTPEMPPTQFAELRAEVASLKAENEQMVERLTDELNRLAERLAPLEAQALRPWWQRVFALPAKDLEPAGRPRSQAVARLRAIRAGPDGSRIPASLSNIGRL